VQLQEDVLLALEVVVQRRLGDPEALGDVAERGLVRQTSWPTESS
jgi:hypothetical protein